MAVARVLVVDDDPDVAGLVRLDFELAGYEVSVAHDGAEALAALRHQGVDLVVLDLRMPGIDGWQVLATMQADERLAGVPIVVLTALTGEADLIRARLSGASRYLTKPFDLEVLLSTVREVLAPATDDVRARRNTEVARLLQRLAELETGRERSSVHVRLSRLERVPPRGPTTSVDPARLAQLTVREREVAALFAAGAGARHVAAHLGSSRANVYATRKRISRKLGVSTDLVADTARALGLDAEARENGNGGARADDGLLAVGEQSAGRVTTDR